MSRRGIFSAALLSGLFWASLATPSVRAADPGVDPDCEAKLAKLPEGKSVIATDLQAFKVTGNGGGSSIVPVEGMPFKEAIRIETTLRPKNVYDIHLVTPNVETMALEEAFLLSFYGRRVSEHARVEPLFEKSSPDWTKFVHQAQTLDSQWKKYYIRFTIRKKWDTKELSYAPGAAHLAFNLGFDPQTLELADIKCVRFPKSVGLKEIPSGFDRYAGMEADAPWRKEAERRIEQNRKGDFSLEVVDASGSPVKGASVKVEMKRHAFLFGTAITAEQHWTERYMDEVKGLFNFVVLENNLKWGNWDNKQTRASTERMLARFAELGIPVRGHCLVWPSWKYMPSSMKKLEKDPAALRKSIVEHVKEEASACRGKVVEWDVMNEPFTNHDVMDVCGDDVMVDWFKAAKESDPGVKFFINDFDILSHCEDGDSLSEHQRHYLKTIKYLIDSGAPLDGIGMQGHFGMQPTPPEKMLKMLDLFSQFGKEIKITEYDNEFYDDVLSADFTRDLMTVLFSHPSVTAFLMWGFWDGAHWLSSSPIYNTDWTLKPSGQVYKDLVFKAWWTNLDGKSDASGVFKGRGFLGAYEATVEFNGKTVKSSFILDKSKPSVKIKLD